MSIQLPEPDNMIMQAQTTTMNITGLTPAPAARPIHICSWPLASLGDGIEALCRKSGYYPQSSQVVAPPTDLLDGGNAELGRWIEWAGETMGLEAQSLETTPAGMSALLRGCAPALVRVRTETGPMFYLLMKTKGDRIGLLCPDLKIRYFPVKTLEQEMAREFEAPMSEQIDQLLELAAVSRKSQGKVRTIIARERLDALRIDGIWSFSLPPSASFWGQLKQAQVPKLLTFMVVLFASIYALEIFSWSTIGAAALDGHLDFGWLTAWVLLVLSMIPLRLAGNWFDSKLSLDVGRLLKTRLLSGGLKLDIETMRQEGAGHILGRVLESQAFEALAVNGGASALIAIIELVFSIWLLSIGAGGWLHVTLFAGWLAIAVGLSVVYYRSLSAWSNQRLDMTHSLVERMIGHRTVLAQDWAERRVLEEDHAMNAYLEKSTTMDNAVLPFLAGIPAGWTILGIIGLAPAFIFQNATASGIAISLGAILFAGRAFSGVSEGLAAIARAIIAWQQIGPLFRAGGQQTRPAAFIPARRMHPKDIGTGLPSLISADQLSYQYDRRAEPVLNNARLTIKHGDRMLLEGTSGGGKSTLASLLVGLRQPGSGLLLLNGLDRATLGDAWHQFVTEAPQFHENHILSGTLGFNLLMGRAWPPSDEDMGEARELCIDLGLGDLLDRMPSGMMQTIGETGWQLSHGEKSRIFLARALLQNAQLTILDESFAALDPETLELCLDTAFKRANALMVIAHP